MKLSKTEYLLYSESPRHLWAYVNGKTDQKKIDTFIQHLFDQGHQVEKLAREYIKEHLIPDHYKNSKEFAFEETQYDERFESRMDFLVLNTETNLWDIYEIKSSNKVKKEHIEDLAFQKLVFQKKYKIGESYILHLDKEYVKEVDLDLQKLFARTNISNEVEEAIDSVHETRYEALHTMELESHEEAQPCRKPKECPCASLCHPDLPEHHIYSIGGLVGSSKRKVEHLEDNFSKDIHDVPSNVSLPNDLQLTPLQRIHVDTVQSDKIYIDNGGIDGFLSELKYPYYFLDYESLSPAVPIHKGYSPFDQMPFQYSLHIQKEAGADLIHKEFLETGIADPSLSMLEQLSQDIENDGGSIIIWSKFERTQHKNMAERYPQYREFLEGLGVSKEMNGRLWDLAEPFSKKMYYDPKFKGRWSIKKVLPVLVPELSYEGLDIADGATAMILWSQMVYGGGITVEFNGEKGEEVLDIPQNQEGIDVSEALLEYCKLDTLAMVKLLEALKKLI